MRANLLTLLPLLIFMLVTDLYTYRGILPLIKQLKTKYLQKILKAIFWGINISIFITFILYFTSTDKTNRADSYVHFSFIVASFFLFYVPKIIFIVFVLINDIQLFFRKVFSFFQSKTTIKSKSTNQISRSDFLYKTGLLIAAVPFASILYGITKGKFDYRVLKEKIFFSNLPSKFKGFKIIQISDIHLGSFNKNFDAVKKAVTIINEQNPDLILFTGDLVNNFAEETLGWAPILSKMKAKYGKFSVLGNHDYGDYSQWPTEDEKAKNLQQIKDFHQEIGFQLLLNENQIIKIKDQEIALLGVENWGHPPFPQYGNLTKALQNCEHIPFQLLMSHDPSHWDAEVLQNNIDLTFSGHTHGMQFGIEIPGVKWSPVQYKYPRWGGLYREKNQYLYVNRGFGYIGFPGRVGMPPEITLIELA